MNIYTHQSENIFKTWVLMGGFFIFVILITWVFAGVYGNPSILYFGVIFSVLMNVGSYWYSDKLVLAMSHAKPIAFQENPELYRIVENLSITSGLPMPKLYIINEAQPNAFATGRDKEHGVVAVTTGILQVLNKEELTGVLAHEMSHIGNRDMLVSTVAVVLVGFISLVSDFFLRSMLWGGHSDNNDRKNQGIFLAIGIGLAILAPIVASLIRLAISRKREFLADASGAMLTRYPEGLASALEKISANSNPMSSANHATAHLYIANPFKGRGATSFLTKLFMTHPPIEERVRVLRNL